MMFAVESKVKVVLKGREFADYFLPLPKLVQDLPIKIDFEPYG